jgi:hypothetical protein
MIWGLPALLVHKWEIENNKNNKCNYLIKVIPNILKKFSEILESERMSSDVTPIS